MYALTKEEGGRHTPFFNNYRPQFFMRTADITGSVTLPANVKMVMPGDNTRIVVDLAQPTVLEVGMRFALREGGRTVGAGVVTKLLGKLSQEEKDAAAARLKASKETAKEEKKAALQELAEKALDGGKKEGAAPGAPGAAPKDGKPAAAAPAGGKPAGKPGTCFPPLSCFARGTTYRIRIVSCDELRRCSKEVGCVHHLYVSR
jgi:hypothetical protein